LPKLVGIKDLIVRFYTYEGVVKALEGVNLDIEEGETLGLVGETGSGKSVTAFSIMLLVPPPGKIESGKILFREQGKMLNLVEQGEEFMRKIRGDSISMIFQEPSAALNPVYTVYDQISESFWIHRREELIKEVLKKLESEIEDAKRRRRGFRKWVLEQEVKIYAKMLKNPSSLQVRACQKIPFIKNFRKRLESEMRKRVVEILRDMEIPNPEGTADRYPHELSGGMQQRVVIAMALACSPKLLIADEPTTSLDVTVEAQILDLIRKLKREYGSSVLFITHDLGIIAEMCDRVGVMYAGNIVELANVREIFENPLHPYTIALLESIPSPRAKRLKPIEGTIPSLVDPPPGCRFHPRCSKRMDICSKIKPELKEVRKKHWVACHLY